MKKSRIHLLTILFVAALSLLFLLVLAPTQPGRAQGFGVSITPNREAINVRIAPAIGFEVIGRLVRGQTVIANGRNPGGDWLRIDLDGQEGWVGTEVVGVISGNPAALPINDPLTLPLNFGDGPRAGSTTAFSTVQIRLPESGLRFRAGPSTAYFVMGNVPRYEVMQVTGRSPNGDWLQVNFRGNLGWVANQFIEWMSGSVDLLPVYGIIATGPPLNQPDTPAPFAERDAILNAMLLHINLSINQLDVIENVWWQITRGGADGDYPCDFGLNRPQPYIPRPEDLTAYPELDSVIADMNEGLWETREAINEWQLLCDLALRDYPIVQVVVDRGVAHTQNARIGYERARQQILALGVGPTEFVEPGFTPAPPVNTLTPGANLTPLEAFGLDGNRITFVPQFVEPTDGCNWQGFAGQVFGLNGEVLVGYSVRIEGITDQSFIAEGVSGSAPEIGPSGWIVQVSSVINTFGYRITLYQDGRRVSDPRNINFPNDCTRNLGLVNFVQLRSLNPTATLVPTALPTVLPFTPVPTQAVP